MFLMLCITVFAQDRYAVNAGEGVQIDYSNPKVFEIADISITGLVGLQESALLALTGIKVGDKIPIPGQEISDGIKKLWNQGIIADVQFWLTKTEGDRAFIEVRVSERPRIQEARIRNVNSSQASEMLDQLSISGKVATPALIKNSEILIRKFFFS